jgi:hypothetical protein
MTDPVRRRDLLKSVPATAFFGAAVAQMRAPSSADDRHAATAALSPELSPRDQRLSAPNERIVKEDLELGFGTVTRTKPGGGSALGHRIGIHTFFPDTYNVRDFGALGDGSTDDTAAIQAAITACPAYGMVLLPPGHYLLSGGLTITRPLTLAGSGFATILYVLPTVAASTNIVTVAPATDGHYFVFRDFCIAARSGTPGRHTIYLDGSATYVGDSIFSNLQLYKLNATGNAIYGAGSGGDSRMAGNPVITTIQHCVLGGGIAFEQCGDTVRVVGNHIAGPGKAVDVSFVSGASTFVFKNNSVTNDGGLRVGGRAVAMQIVENEFETTATFTGSNGALLDLDGTSAHPAADTIIARNSFQVVNGITTNTIRVNHAVRTAIFSNRFGRGLTNSRDVVVSANATDTFIGTNLWATGVPIASMVSDSGVGTVFAGAWGGAWHSAALVRLGIGASGVDAEQIRFGRRDDDKRYNSVFSKSSGSGNAGVEVFVHDGVSEASQIGLMGWYGNGIVAFLTQPPVHANNAAAKAAGLSAGQIYRTNGDPDVLCVVHT